MFFDAFSPSAENDQPRLILLSAAERQSEKVVGDGVIPDRNLQKTLEPAER